MTKSNKEITEPPANEIISDSLTVDEALYSSE